MSIIGETSQITISVTVQVYYKSVESSHKADEKTSQMSDGGSN